MINQERLKVVRDKWVRDLMETFEIPANKKLVDLWTKTLAQYDEDVLHRGWSEFVSILYPGRLPELKRAMGIFHKHQGIANEEKNLLRKKREKEEIEKVLGDSHTTDTRQFVAMCLLGMKKIKAGEWTKREYFLKVAEFFDGFGMKRDAKEMRDRAEALKDTETKEKPKKISAVQEKYEHRMKMNRIITALERRFS